MSRRKKKDSPWKVVGAVAILLVGAVICYRSLAGTALPPAAQSAPADEPLPEDGGEPVGDGEVRRSDLGDLLAVVGSYRQGAAVRSVFRAGLPAAAVAPTPAPDVETAPPIAELATDPVPMHVTFVMVHGPQSRACVDGQVVGVGSKVAAGVVLAIQDKGVQVRGQGRTLFYDLADPLPREFRAEAARRAAQKATEGEDK